MPRYHMFDDQHELLVKIVLVTDCPIRRYFLPKKYLAMAAISGSKNFARLENTVDDVRQSFHACGQRLGRSDPRRSWLWTQGGTWFHSR